MAENSKISWTDHTFNPWWGCVKVSPACDHCYAESFSKRVGNDVWGLDAPRRFFGDKHWNEPLKWNRTALEYFGRPARVFCASMADVFEDRADLHNHRLRLFDLFPQTPNLLWNLLTKRSTEIKRYLPELQRLPNVRIGVTVENQTYDHRVVPGVSWISYEPALGPLNLHLSGESCTCSSHQFVTCRGIGSLGEGWKCAESKINWVIIGGESGGHAREMKLEWAIDVIAQCKAAGVAVHFKQLGDVLARKLGVSDKYYDTGKKDRSGNRVLKRDVSGKYREFWPEALQVQEFPA